MPDAPNCPSGLDLRSTLRGKIINVDEMTKEVLENALIDKENIRLLEQEEEMRLEEEAQTERNRLQDAITSELKNVVLLKDLVDKFCKDFTKIAVKKYSLMNSSNGKRQRYVE